MVSASASEGNTLHWKGRPISLRYLSTNSLNHALLAGRTSSVKWTSLMCGYLSRTLFTSLMQ